MGPDGLQEVVGATIVQKEDALAQSPQGRRTKLVRAGIALNDVISQYRPHVVDEEIGEQIRRLVTERGWR